MINPQQQAGRRAHGLAIAVTLALHVAVFAALGLMDIQKPIPPVQSQPIQLRVIQLPKSQPKPPSKPQPTTAPVVEATSEPKIQPELPQAKTVEKMPIQKAIAEQVQKPQVAKSQPNKAQADTAIQKKIVDSNSSTHVPAKATSSQQVQQQTASTEHVAQQHATPTESTKAVQPALVTTELFDVKNYQPVSKIAPDYPDQAMDRKLEGDCTVVYQVNAQGRVEQPKAESDCHPLFVRPSIQAAKNFKYQPRVVDGQAVAVANVRNTFQYRIKQQ